MFVRPRKWRLTSRVSDEEWSGNLEREREREFWRLVWELNEALNMSL